MILRNNLRVLILLGKAESGNISCCSAIAKIGTVIDSPPELEARYNALLTRSRIEQQQEQMRNQAERLAAAEAEAAELATTSYEGINVEPDEIGIQNDAAAGEPESQEDIQAAERAASLCACHELIKAITDGRDPPALPFSEEISQELNRVVRIWFEEKGLWNKRMPPVKFAGNLVAALGTLLARGLDTSMTIEELVSVTGIERNRIQSVTNEHKSGSYLRCTPWEILGARGKYKLVAREQRRSA